MSDDRPAIDDRDPADAVAEMVDHVLRLAETWTAWDGRPRPVDDRVYTPHKAIRRAADHMIDHLAQLESHLAGVPAQGDGVLCGRLDLLRGRRRDVGDTLTAARVVESVAPDRGRNDGRRHGDDQGGDC